MKRDLEIAREIQPGCAFAAAGSPGREHLVRHASAEFRAGDYYDAFYPNPEDREKLMVVIAE